MGRRLILSLCAQLLAGCAADTMRSYVGQDIRNVELAYGPPINQINLGNGSRAFQWGKVSVDTTPVSALTTTDKDRKGRETTQTRFTGGETTVTRLSLHLRHDPERRELDLTGTREPSLDCAIGDLS